MKIALLQHACETEAAENLKTVEAMARQAAAGGAELVMTEELFASRYFCQTEDDRHFALAEPIPGPTSHVLCDLATALGIWLSASLFERRTAGVYHNTSIMIAPNGSIADRYRKMHIPDDPRFYEKYYFTPGDLGFRVQHLGDLTTGMLVCWDQWYPEAARLTAMQGAQLLMYPTAIGWYTVDAADGEAGTHGETPETRQQQIDAWRMIQRSHAIANGVYVAACNRIGTEDELQFWGRSFVADPSGQVIAEASGDQQEVLYAEIDVDAIEQQRQGWPFFRDRRIDAYGPITARFLDE